ncbi:hypothetical protein [Clostridium akagii]|uniref:hypothetical protein n=1 Tax=Clostridium akagii TaxID=91623 RepID=UPI000478D9F1|nr:hypothetical protein [Clostridium akagii]
MSFGKLCKTTIAFFSVIFLIFNSTVYVQAATYIQPYSNNNLNQFSLNDIHTIGNISNTKIVVNNLKDIDVDINSNKFKKGYYSSVLYKVISGNWSNYGTLSFDINNKSKGYLSLSYVMQQSNGTSLTVVDNKSVMLKEEKSNLLERVHPSNGSIEIPENFKGTVYIPFSSLGEKGQISNDKKYIISNIVSWGLVATIQENQEKSFELSNFSLINNGEKIDKIGKLNYDITGDSDVQVPVLGESIALYKVIDGDSGLTVDYKNIKFQLKTPVKGVKITNEGRLVISTNVKPQKIKIIAKMGDTSMGEIKEIKLFKSWTLSPNAKDKNGNSQRIPDPSSVPSLMTNGYKLFLNEITINTIRIIVLVMFCAFMGLFFWWKDKYVNK